ncbi:hypothetical protein H6768_04775 [Candidatus Peribacteria bacterium]|nr:hypothetical protein [Candidatus Peribacteria bacterium]
MKNPLLAYSNNPDALLARGISQTALALNHPQVNELRQRVLDVLQLKKHSPLTPAELEIILDCLTSPAGNNSLALVNHRLFCGFLEDQSSREGELFEDILRGL